MKIEPLPVFEADADPHQRDAMTLEEQHAALTPPKTVVVKFGAMKLIGEYAYEGDVTPGCGSKLVARTHRGTEIAEMLTTTCENAGCNKSITRQEMREFIENSGGKDFPFFTDGKVLRIATIEDLNKQSELNGEKSEHLRTCRELIEKHRLAMKLVDCEPILGGELLTFYYMSEDRVDFRALVRELAATFKTRIDLRQVGARDEARLVADYERCGQHCCCKTFLKVLKPVSMRAAKVQKATLDPLKISGRCGRLMCCLRYEDQTYKELKKNLPHRRSRVGTQFGPGTVVETKILVQLALVRLEHNNEEVAVPVEELMDPETCPKPGEVAARKLKEADDALRGMTPEEVEERTDDSKRRKRKRGGRRKRSKAEQQDAYRETSQAEQTEAGDRPAGDEGKPDEEKKGKRGRRRGRGRGRGKGRGKGKGKGKGSEAKGQAGGKSSEGGKRRRRGGKRRRGKGRGGSGGGGKSGGGSGGDSGGGSGGGSGDGGG